MTKRKAEREQLFEFLTPTKQAAITRVAKERTRHVTVVLEDVRQAQNASAVVRSCDCFGIQDLHVIENNYPFELNKMIVRGSSKWVDVYRHKSLPNNTAACIDKLKNQGYKIIATSPHANDYPIQELPLDHKIALFMGTEGSGLSQEVLDSADYFTTVPMYGFTESLNLSVCAALCLNQLMTRLHSSTIDWRMQEEERYALEIQWAKSILQNHTIYDNQIEL